MIHLSIQDTSVPALGFGTWQLKGQGCRDGVEHALALGYRHIDTAQAYENEEEVGAAIKASGVPRDAVFLTTKVWRDRFEADALTQSVHDSLRRLDTDYVDLLLLHWPVPEVPLEESLGAMQSLAEAGKVRHIGVSNFTPSMMNEAASVAPIFANQVEYHPFLGHPRLMKAAASHDAMVTAYSPLARGAVGDDPTLVEIGEAHGKSPFQVTLRWLVQQGRVSAIPKAASAGHRKSNLEIFDFALSDAQMQQIADLDQGRRLIDPSWAPQWEEGG